MKTLAMGRLLARMASTVDAIADRQPHDPEVLTHAGIASASLHLLADRLQELDDEQLEDGLVAAGTAG